MLSKKNVRKKAIFEKKNLKKAGKQKTTKHLIKQKQGAVSNFNNIEVCGARENNLKNISVKFPRNKNDSSNRIVWKWKKLISF